MKNNQKGFGLIEALLVVVVVGLVGGIGWYLLQRQNNEKDKQSTANTQQSIKTKSYIDSSKLYSLVYPETWTVKEAPDCCEGPAPDYMKVSRSVDFIPPNKSDIHGYGLQVQADSTSALAKQIEQGWTYDKHTPQAKTINGNSVKYVKVAFKGDAEDYTDHRYLITHNEASVYITFRETYFHQYPAEDWSAAQDMDAFNAILRSVTFLK